jgi:tryptophanyl-tRNA synthetase
MAWALQARRRKDGCSGARPMTKLRAIGADETVASIAVEHAAMTMMLCISDLHKYYATAETHQHVVEQQVENIELAYLALRALRASINAASTTPRILGE